ncbi:MAG: hypothetical protein U0T75_08885 [Chitinophagales bacterium]
MKKYMIIPLLLIAVSITAQPKLYIGLRGGAGVLLGANQLKQFSTSDGTRDIVTHSNNWALNPKIDVLLGLGRFHLGYRFMYTYSKNVSNTTGNYTPVDNGGAIDNPRLTTYFNGTRMNMFAHYGVLEFSIINSKVFALTPGIALGGYTGYIKDDAGNKVKFNQVSRMRITAGTELNFEIKFNHGSFIFGPNYYLFARQDKATADWKQFNHLIGADLGLRFSLF